MCLPHGLRNGCYNGWAGTSIFPTCRDIGGGGGGGGQLSRPYRDWAKVHFVLGNICRGSKRIQALKMVFSPIYS